MIVNCFLIFLGGYTAIVTFFAYDTYQDNLFLKKELKKYRKDDKSE